MGRHKCYALAASLLSCIATGFAPALAKKRQLVLRAHSDDAAELADGTMVDRHPKQEAANAQSRLPAKLFSVYFRWFFLR